MTLIMQIRYAADKIKSFISRCGIKFLNSKTPCYGYCIHPLAPKKYPYFSSDLFLPIDEDDHIGNCAESSNRPKK